MPIRSSKLSKLASGTSSKLYLALVLLLPLFNSCSDENSHSAPDVSHINVDLKLDRFERDFFSLADLPDQQIPEELSALKNSWPIFAPFYVEELMNMKEQAADGTTLTGTTQFLRDKNINELLDSVKQRFPDLSFLEQEMESAFAYAKYYLPALGSPPRLVSYLGGFGPAAITLENEIIGVNLDMYLGKDFPFYSRSLFPKYLSHKFEPDYMAINMMRVWSREQMAEPDRTHRLIDEMIYNGKQLYFLEMVFPEVDPALIIGFKNDQYNWCLDNEIEMWSFFLEKELIYENESRKYQRFVNDGPTTSGMPPESPGNTGSYIGWQIVKRYMENNPEVSMQQLFNEKDGQKILRASKYKPKRRKGL